MNPVFFGIQESNYSVIEKKNLRKPNPIEYSQENKLIYSDEKLPTNMGLINIYVDGYSVINSSNLLTKNPTENVCYKILKKKEIYEESYV